MKTSQHGIDTLFKPFEGLRLKAYQDDSPGRVWTIGWGHTRNVKPTDVIDEAQAEAFLAQDLAEAEQFLAQHVTVPLSQNEFDALCSIVFNVGPGNPKRDGIIRLASGQPSTLLRKLNARDYLGAAQEFPKWCHEGKLISAGLLRRRKAEQLLFLTPDLPIAA
jgi:lysozyme